MDRDLGVAKQKGDHMGPPGPLPRGPSGCPEAPCWGSLQSPGCPWMGTVVPRLFLLTSPSRPSMHLGPGPAAHVDAVRGPSLAQEMRGHEAEPHPCHSRSHITKSGHRHLPGTTSPALHVCPLPPKDPPGAPHAPHTTAAPSVGNPAWPASPLRRALGHDPLYYKANDPRKSDRG